MKIFFGKLSEGQYIGAKVFTVFKEHFGFWGSTWGQQEGTGVCVAFGRGPLASFLNLCPSAPLAFSFMNSIYMQDLVGVNTTSVKTKHYID